MSLHPCLSCGACCSFFKVTFHWSETMKESYGVPLELTTQSSSHKSLMVGSDLVDPRCIAFKGIVGTNASCSIYDNRPSTCRSFKASFEDGIQDERCDKAREAKGLEVLSLKSWIL